MCEEQEDCDSDIKKYMVQDVPNLTKTYLPIGIAKDGHMIMGPYKKDGTLWQPCDIDACNGVTINQNYVYVSTLFHPYTVGCWGPSSTPSFPASCSTNSRTCQGSDAVLLLNNPLMVLAISIFTMLSIKLS